VTSEQLAARFTAAATDPEYFSYAPCTIAAEPITTTEQSVVCDRLVRAGTLPAILTHATIDGAERWRVLRIEGEMDERETAEQCRALALKFYQLHDTATGYGN
jgi:hypothetical protein